MPYHDWLILIGMGGLFIILGLAAIAWGQSEEKNYYNAISTRRDVREFLVHWPFWPQFGALKIGGRIAIVIGVLMLVSGGALWWWG